MRGQGQVTPIDVLHDDVLLAVFDFHDTYRGNYPCSKHAVEAWLSLVHVCKRWRWVVFGSPRRLNLRLFCSPGTPVRGRLDVWPALPLIVHGDISSTSVDNIVFALEHSDRVCRIDLRGDQGLQWDKVFAAMEVPFPALTDLLLHCWGDEAPPLIPDNFLSGFATPLRSLKMSWIPFPDIPNPILELDHLVNLDLSESVYYIQPDEMAECLSVFTCLHTLSLSFQFRNIRSHRRLPWMDPTTLAYLPDLNTLRLKGTSEYLDDLVAKIVAPRLVHLSITFLIDEMNFDTPHLVQFINRTPRFKEPRETHLTLDSDVMVRVLWASASDDHRHPRVEISYGDLDADLHPHSSFFAQIYTMCLPPLPTVENLRLGYFDEDLYSNLNWKDDVENDEWLELLRPFTAVKNLYLSEEFQPYMASVLQEFDGGRTTDVLPSLQNIFLADFEPSGTFQEAIGQFVAARQFSGYPIAVLPM